MEDNVKSIYERLALIQEKIAVPKDRKNEFGGFSFRNAEDILKAAKPLAHEQHCAVIMSEELVNINGETYVKSTATLVACNINGDAKISCSAYAREANEKKGMDVSQITGSATSYARKYALGGLFAIDDGIDADSMDNSKNYGGRKPYDRQSYADKCKQRGRQAVVAATRKIEFNNIKAKLETIDNVDDLEEYWRSLGKLSDKQAAFLQKLFAKRKEQINGLE